MITLHDKSFVPFISATEIATRVEELAAHFDALVSSNLQERNQPLLVLGILRGAVIFHSDLIRTCTANIEVEYLRTHSYKGLKSTGKVSIDVPPSFDVKDRHVVIVEDIVDSGLTLKTLVDLLLTKGATKVTTIVLLDKKDARTTPFTPTLVGFDIPDLFVVGYGLDYNGLGRNLPSIYQLSEL